MWLTSTGSARIASTIGPGSARPLVSSTIRSKRLAARPGPAALVTDAAQQRDQFGPGRRSRRSRRRAPRCRAARVEQRVVDRRFGRLVDDDESVRVASGMELVAQPAGLARAEKAAEHGEPHAAVGPSANVSRLVPAADEARVERIDRPAGEPLGRRPDLGEIAHDGVVAGQRRDLDARHLRRRRGRSARRPAAPTATLARGGSGRAAGPAPSAAPASVQWPGAAGNPQLSTSEPPSLGSAASPTRRTVRVRQITSGRLALFEGIALAEIRGDLLEGHPLRAAVLVDVLDQALEHQQHLRPAGRRRDGS